MCGLYVLANINKEEQEKCIKQAEMNGHFAKAIGPNCLELLLDGDRLIFEHDGSEINKEEFFAGKTRFHGPRALLTLTTMSPDDIGHYYNWCSLEAMLDPNPRFIPLWLTKEEILNFNNRRRKRV